MKTDKITVILMIVIIGLLIAPMLQLAPSDECQAARDQVELISSVVLEDATYNYDQIVYELADNINQQQFRVAEFQYYALVALIKQQTALIDVTTYCK